VTAWQSAIEEKRNALMRDRGVELAEAQAVADEQTALNQIRETYRGILVTEAASVEAERTALLAQIEAAHPAVVPPALPSLPPLPSGVGAQLNALMAVFKAAAEEDDLATAMVAVAEMGKIDVGNPVSLSVKPDGTLFEIQFSRPEPGKAESFYRRMDSRLHRAFPEVKIMKSFQEHPSGRQIIMDRFSIIVEAGRSITVPS
jgi:hypothetical protein